MLSSAVTSLFYHNGCRESSHEYLSSSESYKATLTQALAVGAVPGLVFVRAISWLPFISGGVPICLRPVISGRQSLCTGYEVKPLRRYFRSGRKQ
jgi:hypothetical protein